MNDLISRKMAIDALDEQLDYLQMLNKDENPKAESKWYGVNWARNTIADLPSADRPQGEWEERPSNDLFSMRRWYCSECGEWQTYGMTDFCPNCGARMKGADDERVG